MMDEQKIIDNAQDNATHYDCCEYMRHVHNGNWEYWSKASGWEETVPEDDTRSLADIKEIVELRNANAELKKTIKELTDGVTHFNRSRGDISPLLEAYTKALKAGN
jgi:hypothetical protein